MGSTDKAEMVSLHITLPKLVVETLDAEVRRRHGLPTWPKPSRLDLIRTVLGASALEMDSGDTGAFRASERVREVDARCEAERKRRQTEVDRDRLLAERHAALNLVSTKRTRELRAKPRAKR